MAAMPSRGRRCRERASRAGLVGTALSVDRERGVDLGAPGVEAAVDVARALEAELVELESGDSGVDAAPAEDEDRRGRRRDGLEGLLGAVRVSEDVLEWQVERPRQAADGELLVVADVDEGRGRRRVPRGVEVEDGAAEVAVLLVERRFEVLVRDVEVDFVALAVSDDGWVVVFGFFVGGRALLFELVAGPLGAVRPLGRKGGVLGAVDRCLLGCAGL